MPSFSPFRFRLELHPLAPPLTKHGQLLRHRQDEFRTRLDDTLVIAIISDFDLTQQFDKAHTILEGLAQNATAEEASVFNTAAIERTDDPIITDCPPGLSGLEWRDTTETSQDTTESARILCDSSSNTDWAYLLAENLASLELPKDVNVAALDEDGKVAELKLMFAELNDVDLKLALKKAKGDFTRACEELLNLQYLEENGLRPKGIDGAFRDDHLVNYQSKLIKKFICFFSSLYSCLTFNAIFHSVLRQTPPPPHPSLLFPLCTRPFTYFATETNQSP